MMIALGMFFPASFVSAERAVQLSKPTRISMAMVDCTSMPVIMCGLTTSKAPEKRPLGDVLGVGDAVPDGEAAEDDQGGQLDDVDPDSRKRRPRYPPVGDVAGHNRENDADDGHVDDGEVVSRKLVVDIADHRRHHGGHDARIGPVEEMGRPAGGELGYTGERLGAASFLPLASSHAFSAK